MAATFVNLETKRAFRIFSTEESRKLTAKYAPGVQDKHFQQLEAYKIMALDDLFVREEVSVDLGPGDLPGPTRFKAVCQRCHTVVRDQKEVQKNGRILCRPCASGAYYRSIKEQ